MSNKNWWKKLEKLEACPESIEWAKTQPSATAAWRNCKRSDWMLWIACVLCKQNSKQHRRIVLAACKCVRLALKYIPKSEKRPLIAIRVAEKWANNKATLEEVYVAEQGAWDAFYDLSSAAARDAAAAACAAAAAGRAAGGRAAGRYRTAGHDSTRAAGRLAGRDAATAAGDVAGGAGYNNSGEWDSSNYNKAYNRSLAKQANIVRKYVKQPRFK